ncbi:nischarin-like isoform X3 [Pomacea canaliculata]|uniref:nischarin-like isoform X3 n=1 Tax=Pomacea canaliculata TaxID=400727 RepID=UPI000D72F85D|nr:nischarin-like isoform X3 [Pomacea canaliculata]
MAHFGKDLDNFSASRTVQIIDSETTEHFTTYTIEVTVGSYTWTVKHRYSEFYELHEKLTAGYKLDKSLLPPKKLFGNQTESFIRKRQQDLQVYLQTVLHYLAHHAPPALTFFLDFHRYEIHGITQALAEDLYNRGETILQTQEVYHMTPLQLYSLTERLKLPEPTCGEIFTNLGDSGDVKKDLGHILDFITRAKNLQICGSDEPVETSNINMNQLKFDLSLFKSLQSLEIISCNLMMVGGLETVKQTLKVFNVYRSATTIKEIVLQDAPSWKGEDGTQLVGGWDRVVQADFSHNYIKEIDSSMQILWRVEQLDLSHNQLENVQNLQWLSNLTQLDLSHNRLRRLDSLHTKLGNVTSLSLAGNMIETLQGFSKLFSLQVLDVSNNRITALEDVKPVCQLPCLEKLFLSGNQITLTVDYRTKVLEMFGDRVDEVILDSVKASQKEKDTVAVRQALQKARDMKGIPRKVASSASLFEYSILGQRSSSPVNVASVSSSAPHHTSVHNWSVADNSPQNVFIPSRCSPSQSSVSSCASAREALTEGSIHLIPEAHPFDHTDAASSSSQSSHKERIQEFMAAELPTMTSLDFVAWLQTRLFGNQALTNTNNSNRFSSKQNCSITREITPVGTDHVVDVMWCYVQQYSAPGLIFPCCVVLTTTKMIVERMSPSISRSSFQGIPDLQPCIVLPLCSIQHTVIGPCHAYIRLEEAFVGKSGLFTLFALDSVVLKHFANSLIECCLQLDASNPLDILDLSRQSDLLSEICRREEMFTLPSERLVFVTLLRVKEVFNIQFTLLVMSENKLYCLDPACVYWPPAIFESAHEDSIHLNMLQEFSIMENIRDVALQAAPGAAFKIQTVLADPVKDKAVHFKPTLLTMLLGTSASQQELTFFFSTPSSCDLFLDRLTNLRAEHAHRMLPTVREAPEGGNESPEVTDRGDISPKEKTHHTIKYSSQDTSVQVCTQPVLHTVAVASLPSSFDWKRYYFPNSSPYAFSYHDSQGSRTLPVEDLQKKTVTTNSEDLLRKTTQQNLLPGETSENKEENEASATSLIEQELRQAVRTYNLLHPLLPTLQPLSLMSGREVMTFFYSKIAGTSVSVSTEPPSSSGSLNSTPEELQHVLWSGVVPYNYPAMEIVTLIMLSTRAIYFVSDANTTITSAPGVRPSWMTHVRNNSDSAVGWHSRTESLQRGNSRGAYWHQVHHVKPYAVVALADLVQVSVGLFDQFLRVTGPDAQTVFTLATRDSRQTAMFVDKLKSVLSLLVISPAIDKSPMDSEQDIYRAFAKRTNSTVEGLVFTHPSKVTFLYPGDDAIEDILFLIKAKAQSATLGVENSLTSVISLTQQKEVVWLYILAYQVLSPFGEIRGTLLPDCCQSRSVIVTSHHLCLVQEDIVTYPLPDFVRGMPEQPQHDIVEMRRLESLKRIVVNIANPRLLSLVFWDEPEELVVDTSMEHFSQVVAGRRGQAPGEKKGGGILPEVVLRVFIQCQRDKDKLLQVLQKQWQELVPQVGRLLDIVRE